jgi:hypothetical protein
MRKAGPKRLANRPATAATGNLPPTQQRARLTHGFGTWARGNRQKRKNWKNAGWKVFMTGYCCGPHSLGGNFRDGHPCHGKAALLQAPNCHQTTHFEVNDVPVPCSRTPERRPGGPGGVGGPPAQRLRSIWRSGQPQFQAHLEGETIRRGERPPESRISTQNG